MHRIAEYSPETGLTYRDATAEEVEEMERQLEEITEPEPTPEERIAALEQQNDDLILLMAELIGGDEL